MISDDDVMRAFEQADPARLPDPANDRVDGTGYLAELRQRSTYMTLTESSQTETPPAASRRWTWVVAAAATATLFVVGVVLLSTDDEPPSTAVSADEIDVAERFIGALNDRDLAAIEVVSTDGLTIDQTEDLPSLMAWFDAFDWRWEDADCSTQSVGADVQCELFERNRLTDLTGAERPASVSFTLTDGQVESVDVDADLSDYSPNAFEPFQAWVAANHPDDARQMWTDTASPVLTAESAALFDQHLTEYTTAVSADEIDVAERFIGALNDRDLAAIEVVSTDGLTIDQTEDLPSLMAWFDAFDWRWEDADCSTQSVGADVQCELFERNRLTDLTGAERPASVSFTLTDGQVESVDVDADLSDYSPNAFEPFQAWVAANHPDDARQMWTDTASPVLTAESAALFDQHLTEYIDEVRSTADE